tara:strand:+ start:70 stop:288 length:219 start_codon:yes stop_codon:yes gene_type:complete
MFEKVKLWLGFKPDPVKGEVYRYEPESPYDEAIEVTVLGTKKDYVEYAYTFGSKSNSKIGVFHRIYQKVTEN